MSLRLRCPDSMKPHVARVLQGEYDVDVSFDRPPIVLDIGANIGAFTIWAQHKWPGCFVHCYEPHPDNLALLWRNVHGEHVRLHWAAVVEEKASVERVQLFDGVHNCGEASTKQIGEQAQTGGMVPWELAVNLPHAQVVKIDTEGCERDILRGLFLYPPLVLLEAHGQDERDAISDMMKSRGYAILKDLQTMPHRWTMGFRREP